MILKEQRTLTKEIEIGRKCDSCGTVVLDMKSNLMHGFNWHHLSWGRDSIDSYVWVHVCSAVCYTKQIKIALTELYHEKHNAEIDDMPYFLAEQLVELIEKKG